LIEQLTVTLCSAEESIISNTGIQENIQSANKSTSLCAEVVTFNAFQPLNVTTPAHIPPPWQTAWPFIGDCHADTRRHCDVQSNEANATHQSVSHQPSWKLLSHQTDSRV